MFNDFRVIESPVIEPDIWAILDDEIHCGINVKETLLLESKKGYARYMTIGDIKYGEEKETD